jgi:hypothetical protein
MTEAQAPDHQPIVQVQTVTGQPTDDEVAAIVAALQLVWPTARPVVSAPDRSTVWRTSHLV